MLFQLALGAALTVATLSIAAVFISVAIRQLQRLAGWLSSPTPTHRVGAVLALSTLWMLAALMVAIWLWAVAYYALDAFESMEASLYFSIVAFTTLGFGDVLPPSDLRLTAGVCAANGLLLFGLCTAFLVEVFRRLLPEPPTAEKRSHRL